MQGRRPPWILVETELYRYPPSRHPGRFRKFWCLCVFFLVWFDYLHDIFSGTRISNSPEPSNQQNTHVFSDCVAPKRQEKAGIGHTHTQILWMEEVLQQLGFINHVSKHMVETCQQNMHPNKIPQERFFHVFARCA